MITQYYLQCLGTTTVTATVTAIAVTVTAIAIAITATAIATTTATAITSVVDAAVANSLRCQRRSESGFFV